MKNIEKMSINEVKNILLEMFDEETVEEILNIHTIEEIADIIENEKESIIDDDTITQKHVISRKKKANRTKKPTTTYKKAKDKKWMEKKRTNLPNEETTSRSYLNKASKGYNKLQPHVKPKAKKENK